MKSIWKVQNKRKEFFFYFKVTHYSNIYEYVFVKNKIISLFNLIINALYEVRENAIFDNMNYL